MIQTKYYYDNVYGTGWNTGNGYYGGWTCGSCGKYVNFGEHHYCCSYRGLTYPGDCTIPSNQLGWECPKCGSIYSPWVLSCWKCEKKSQEGVSSQGGVE